MNFVSNPHFSFKGWPAGTNNSSTRCVNVNSKVYSVPNLVSNATLISNSTVSLALHPGISITFDAACRGTPLARMFQANTMWLRSRNAYLQCFGKIYDGKR